jgi:circadian clock protein KaiB
MDTAQWRLTLYVSGASPESTSALETVRRICDEELRGRVDLQVVDIRDAGAQAAADGIVVVPTLVKRMPGPRRTVAGDLSDTGRVRTALGIEQTACDDSDVP